MVRICSLFVLALAMVVATAPARADDEPQVALAGMIGAAGGGGTTPGGLRVGGRYLYRLSDHDWFDSGVAFTFGEPQAGCGRVPPDGMTCDHGVADGFAGDLLIGLRRELPGRPGFVPFVRGGGFARWLRFTGDDIGGGALGVEAGVGLAAAVSHDLRIVGDVAGFAGHAWLGHDVGGTGQLGMNVSIGAEWRLP